MKRTTPERPITIEEALGRIKRGLVDRSGKDWAVISRKGSSFPWIEITAPAKRRFEGLMSGADRAELSELLGFRDVCAETGIMVAGRQQTLREFIARAEGTWGNK